MYVCVMLGGMGTMKTFFVDNDHIKTLRTSKMNKIRTVMATMKANIWKIMTVVKTRKM